MMITFSNRLVTTVAAVAVAACLQALACAGTGAAGRPGAGGAVAAQATAGVAAQAAAVRYWTPSRMAAAADASAGPAGPAGDAPAGPRRPGGRPRQLARKSSPAPQASTAAWLTGDTAGQGLSWTHGGAVAAAVGKVFFTLAGEDYACSGALVGGKHPDVVLTAAHCVSSGPGPGGAAQWATNWVFVPGFADGLPPYGEYTARRFFVSPDWTGPAGGREQYDAAFVQVAAATLHGAAGAWASGTAQPPPGLPVEFAAGQDAAPPSRSYVFGYPAQAPYSGLDLNYCAGPAVASGGSARTPCGMTAGDSGGPWLAGFSPRAGSGAVFAVSTYKVSGNPRVLYGAVLGPQARALYARAVSRAR
jgi:V8-like Glu-specific endopeptidase